VVIPTFNCLALTQAMFASLQATLSPRIRHEIIFVDDGSTDDTRAWLRGLHAGAAPPHPGRTALRLLFNERNLGYAASNNRGAAAGSGELLALLNNDLILRWRWLEPILAIHDELGSRAGLVGNLQRNASSGELDHAGLDLTPAGKPYHLRHLPPLWWRLIIPMQVVPAVTGACVVVSRALWQRLGGFDEGYRNGGEDIDLCYRARAAGKINVVALRSVVRHHISASPGRKRHDEANSYRLALRWRQAMALDAARAWCWEFLARGPHSSKYRAALAACAFLAHLRDQPPPEAIAGVEDRMGVEFARWREMFGERPPAAGDLLRSS
jgi:GT2 family glycosyltransferase